MATATPFVTSFRKRQPQRRHDTTFGENFMDLRKTMLSVFVLTLATLSGSSGCPSGCQCRQDEVWCMSMNLKEVPRDIPEHARELYFFDNNIQTIPQGSLSRLKNLRLVDLSMNNISDTGLISAEFSKLERLEGLILSHNHITTIPGNLFAGMSKLTRLYLDDNQIRSIHASALRNMSELVELKLSKNRLQSFPKIQRCPKLKRLCLDGNRIISFQRNSLTDVDLEQLTIANNSISRLPSTLFKDISSLREFDISENRFKAVPRIIRNMTRLSKLNLSSNDIASLPSDLISGMRRLKVLDLHNMKLTTLSKNFIPSGVFFNLADFSGNFWHCNCDIEWLAKLVSDHTSVFIPAEKIQCETPRNLKGRTIESLTKKSLNCVGANGGTGNLGSVEPPVTPKKKPNIDLCDGFYCNNGGSCFINVTSSLPTCICTPGWSGLVCQKPIVTPTPFVPTTTTSRNVIPPSPTSSSRPTLHFDERSIKATSADVFLPRIDTMVTISIAIRQGAKFRLYREYNARPISQPYTVSGLEPGNHYKICIIVTDISNNGRKIEDRMCGEVSTPEATTAAAPVAHTVATVAKQPQPADDKVRPALVPNQHGNSEQSNEQDQGHTINEPAKAEFQLLYPALGASLGAFVILIVIVMFYVCYRNKQKLKHKDANDNGPPGSLRREYTRENPGPESEMMMSTQQQHVHYITQQPSVTSTLTQQNGDMHQAPHPSIQAICVSPKRVGTPPKTGSLGRSSNSGSSVTQVAPYVYDRQRCYSTGSGNGLHQLQPQGIDDMRCGSTPTQASYPTNGASYSGHVPYTSSHVPPAMLTNRNQDYVYRAPPQQQRHMSPETYGESCYPVHVVPTVVMPTRGTSTTVNQYHQGPISATTVAPECTYRPINTPAPITGYAPMITRQPMHYSPQKQVASPRGYYAGREPMTSETYRPTITSTHIGAFQDTLVM